MKFEEALSKSLGQYPSLYYQETWKHTRQSVLDSFLLVIGNGMAWHKETGQLVDLEFAADREYADGWQASGKLTETLPTLMFTEDNIDDILLARPKEPHSESMLTTWREMVEYFTNEGELVKAEKWKQKMEPCHNYARYSSSVSLKTWVPYGLSHGGFITKLPDNIDPTWLEAAKELVGYLYEFYTSGIDPYLYYPDNKANPTSPEEIQRLGNENLLRLAEVAARIAEIEKSRM